MAKNLMDSIHGMDVENFDSTGAVASLDYESMMLMEAEEAEFVEQATETEEAIEAFEDASTIAVEVQEEIQTTLENIEDMSPVAVGKALGAIAEKASELVDVVETAVDAEAMDADYKAGARMELEAISDSIKKAWEAVKNFFRSVWAKIKQLIQNVGLWVVNGEKKTKAAKELLGKKSTTLDGEISADKAKEVAKKLLNAVGFFGSTILEVEKSDVNAWLSGLTDMAKTTNVDKEIESLIKTNGTLLTGTPVLDGSTSIKVVRLDGSNLKVVVLKNFDGTNGYHSYASIGVSKLIAAKSEAEIAKGISAVTKGAEIHKEAGVMLANAATIQGKIKSIKDALYKEMSEVGKQVDSDVEKVKFDQGFFKMVWSSTLGKKSAEQMTADEKVRLVRNRASFTSKYTFDVLYGLHGLANGATKAAIISINLLKDK